MDLDVHAPIMQWDDVHLLLLCCIRYNCRFEYNIINKYVLFINYTIQQVSIIKYNSTY